MEVLIICEHISILESILNFLYGVVSRKKLFLNNGIAAYMLYQNLLKTSAY